MEILSCPFCGATLEEENHYAGSNYLCPGKCKDLVIPILKEVVNEQSDCYSFYDGRDPSCRRCRMKKQCKQEFEDTRPECFGVKYGQEEDCNACLDASQCVEFQNRKNPKEKSTMTKKKCTTVRRRRRNRKPVVEEPEVEENEEISDENGEDYTEWTVADLRAELTDRGLEPKGRKSVLVKRLMADDAVDSEPEPEEEEEEAPAPKVRKRRTRVRKVVKEEEEEAEEAPASVAVPTGPTPLSDLVSAIVATLQAGQTLRVVATGAPVGYTLSLGGAATGVDGPVAVAEAEEPAAPKAKGLRGEAFRQEAYTPEFYEFHHVDCGTGKPWGELTYEEKVAFADDNDVEWDEHENPRVDNMRMTKALTEKLGLVKYKPEYQKKAARDVLQGK